MRQAAQAFLVRLIAQPIGFGCGPSETDSRVSLLASTRCRLPWSQEFIKDVVLFFSLFSSRGFGAFKYSSICSGFVRITVLHA